MIEKKNMRRNSFFVLDLDGQEESHLIRAHLLVTHVLELPSFSAAELKISRVGEKK